MKIYRTSEVFVPGGMPRFTYVPRADSNFEERLQSAKDNLCKLVTVTGATKSGKTVLVNRVFPRNECIWVDGGTVKEEEEFWQYILEQISGYTEAGEDRNKEASTSFKGTLEIETGIPLLVKGKGQAGAEYQQTTGNTRSTKLTLSPRSAAIMQLRSVRIPLIIDDFHYLGRDFQGNLIRALKPLIFQGLPVVLIAIPHRRYDSIKVEREITGRLESILIPTWRKEELLEIANEGFPLLNIEVDSHIEERLSDEAYGSPHLMQEFCKELAIVNGILETIDIKRSIKDISNDLFKGVVEGTGKVIFDKLATGPRQRTDRNQRLLKNGETADLYKVTLYALSSLGPGLDTIEYEQLRSAIREVLAETPPRAHEVTRVLEKIAQIASSDESSTPVLDWEKAERKLHITDPFFAFYLKWGVNIPRPQWVKIEITTIEKHGILADIASVIAIDGVNVLKASVETTPYQKNIIQFTIQVLDQRLIEKVLIDLMKLREVISAKRLTG